MVHVHAIMVVAHVGIGVVVVVSGGKRLGSQKVV